MTSRRTALVAALITLAAAAPAEASRLFAVTQTRQVVMIDSAAPATIVAARAITGLIQSAAAEPVKGVDVRPATGEVILLTRSSSATRIYRLDPVSGVASQPIVVQPPLPAGVDFGVDVDPVEDNLHVTGADLGNSQINLTTGARTALTATDAPYDGLAYDSDGDLFAFASDASGSGDDGIGALAANLDDDTGLFGPLAPTDLDPDIDLDTPQNTAVDVAGSTLMIVTRKGGSRRLFALPANSTDATDLGVVGANADVRGMTAVDGVMRFAAGAAADEGGSATLVFVRDAGRAPTTVSWTAQPETAAVGSDFTATSGTVAFAAGEGSKAVDLPIPDDGDVEGNETFTVTMTGATNGTVPAGVRSATVTIVDDDAPPAPAPAPTQVLVPFPVAPPVAVLRAGPCANPLTGATGDDALIGTTAGDLINGGAGADALVGRDGEDCLIGGAGNDWLNAAEGNDQLRGDSGEDFLLGGRGNDVMTGGNGDDRIVGGDGADRISGNGGSNHILGGSGNDRINARNGRRDVIDCGGGRDRVTIDIRRDKTRACETIPGT